MKKNNLALILDDSTDPIDKDGGDGDLGLTDISIGIALNGYTVTFTYDDLSDERYICENFDEVLKLLKEKH